MDENRINRQDPCIVEEEFCPKENEPETEAAAAPKPSLLQKLGRWAGRHKKTLLILAVLAMVAGGLFAFVVRPRLVMGQMAQQGQNVSFIRTTTLQKNTLSDSVSATGLMASNVLGYGGQPFGGGHCGGL